MGWLGASGVSPAAHPPVAAALAADAARLLAPLLAAAQPKVPALRLLLELVQLLVALSHAAIQAWLQQHDWQYTLHCLCRCKGHQSATPAGVHTATRSSINRQAVVKP